MSTLEREDGKKAADVLPDPLVVAAQESMARSEGSRVTGRNLSGAHESSLPPVATLGEQVSVHLFTLVGVLIRVCHVFGKCSDRFSGAVP